MKLTLSEYILLDEQGTCSAQHLAEVSGLTQEELDELIESGVIVASDDNAQPKLFHLRYVVTANMARKLRDDFELDRSGMTLAMTLIRRINELEEEINAVRARFDLGDFSHRH